MLCDVMSFHVVQYYSVLQSTTPVLPRTTKYQNYSVLQSTTTKYYSVLQGTTPVLLYKVLRQYYPELQPVLLRTTRYYASATPYYSSTGYSALQGTTPVLLQYYSVLKSYASTTKYYSSTTPYYKVLRQYYSSTTKYYSVLRQYYSVLQYYSEVSPSNLTKYCACHKKTTAAFQRKFQKTDRTSFPMLGRSENDPTMKPSVRTMRRNRSYFSGSPRAFSIEKYDVSCPVLHSNIHQVLRLPRKVTLERHQELRLPRKATRTTRRNRSCFSGSPRAFSIEKYNISRPILHSNIHHVLHLPQKVTLELHQVLRLPRK